MATAHPGTLNMGFELRGDLFSLSPRGTEWVSAERLSAEAISKLHDDSTCAYRSSAMTAFTSRTSRPRSNKETCVAPSRGNRVFANWKLRTAPLPGGQHIPWALSNLLFRINPAPARFKCQLRHTASGKWVSYYEEGITCRGARWERPVWVLPPSEADTINSGEIDGYIYANPGSRSLRPANSRQTYAGFRRVRA